MTDEIKPIKRYIEWYVFLYGAIVAFFVGISSNMVALRLEGMKSVTWVFIIENIFIWVIVIFLLREFRRILGFPERRDISDPINFNNTYNVLANFYESYKKNCMVKVECEEDKDKKLINYLEMGFFLTTAFLSVLSIVIVYLINAEYGWKWIPLIALLFIFLIFSILWYNTINNLMNIKFLIVSKYPATVLFDLDWSLRWIFFPPPDIYSVLFNTKEKKYYFIRYNFAKKEDTEKNLKERILDYDNTTYRKRIFIIEAIQFLREIPTRFKKRISNKLYPIKSEENK